MSDTKLDLLAQPFEESAIKFKPGVVAGNRALALPYVDARSIQDRLDEALGVAGWQDEYEVLPDGAVVCRLRLKIGGEWITKMDVGSPSEQPDEGDRRKAAFSDALKRAAVKFGIGRYLYRQEAQWVDYDPHKKKFVKPPRMPVAPPGRPVQKLVAEAKPPEQPAPVRQERDPDEVIDDLRVQEIEGLLSARARRWDDARRWLMDQGVGKVEPQAQTADLTWRQYGMLKEALLANGGGKKKQKAG